MKMERHACTTPDIHRERNRERESKRGSLPLSVRPPLPFPLPLPTPIPTLRHVHDLFRSARRQQTLHHIHFTACFSFAVLLANRRGSNVMALTHSRTRGTTSSMLPHHPALPHAYAPVACPQPRVHIRTLLPPHHAPPHHTPATGAIM